ncbi:MAG: peptide ABC transporter substrate-binding protein [Opitutaceae bacterium]|nr:peptide ABC transporter substrate-binding protein [Opitutaceae bacterium]
MNHRTRSSFLLLAAAAALAVLSALSGCKPSAPSGSLQVLHVGNSTEPADLDPQTVTGRPESDVIRTLIEGLIIPDPKTLDPRPGVAERWEVSADGLTYTFHLRADAVWSDGRAITSRDFVDSWKRMLTPALAAEYAYNLYVVAGAEAYHKGRLTDFGATGFQAPDARTVRITLDHPTSYFLNLLLHTSWYPVPLHVVEKFGGLARKGTAWTRPENHVGNGPFVLKEWRQNQKVIVARSPTYWNRAAVKLDEVHLYATDNADTEERMFRTGQLHIARQVPLSKIDTYRTENPAALRVEPFLATAYVRVNTKRPHLADPRVRRALALAIDRESLCRNVLRGTKFPARSLTPPGTAGFTPPVGFADDLAEAKKLLAEAGFPEGRGLPPIEALYPTSDNGRIIMEAIQQMWRKGLGIDARLLNQEWKVYIDSLNTLSFDVSWSAWVGDYADPMTFLDLMTTDSGNNRTGWSNKAFDALVVEARQSLAVPARHALYGRLEEMLARESPVLPLYVYSSVSLVHPRVQGVYPTSLDVHPFNEVWLAPESP